MISDEREWRVSRSGYSIKTGWSDSKKIIASYPHTVTPMNGTLFKEWLDNAEQICALHNAALVPVVEEQRRKE